MAWSVGNSLGSNSSASASSIVITTGAAHTAGQQIIISFAWATNIRTVSSVTDSAGNTYVLLRTRNVFNKCVAEYISAGSIALNSGQTITVTLSGVSAGIMACAVAFANGSITQDASIDNTGAASSDATATWALAQDTELSIASIASVSTAPGDYATPSGWTNLYDFKCTGVSLCLRFDYAIGLASGPRTDTWAGTLKNSWILALASLTVSGASSGSSGMIPVTGAGSA